MKCSEVQKRLSAYQDGELKAGERDKVTTHLMDCSACREQYAELERVWQNLGELQEIHPYPGFYRQVVRKINQPREYGLLPSFQRFFQLLPAPAITSILLVIGILVGIYLGNILAKRGLYSFHYNQTSYSQDMIDVMSLRAFDPIPPGTLGDGYLRMVSYAEKESR